MCVVSFTMLFSVCGRMLLEGKGPIKANHVEAFVLLKKVMFP